MRASVIASACLCACLAAAPPAPAQGEGPVHRIVAEVNGKPITQRELSDHLALDEQWLMAVRQLGGGAARERPAHERRVLDRLIDEALLEQEAETMGLGLSPEEESEVEKLFADYARERWGSKEEQAALLEERGIAPDIPFRRFRASFVGRKVLRVELARLDSFVRPEDVHAYYERNLDRFTVPSRVVYKHIWIDREPGREERAEQTLGLVREALARGDAWDEVCRAHSDGANKAEGGRQEFRDLQAVMPTLREALAKLAPGEMSEVIEVPPRQRPGRVIPGAYVLLRLEELTESGLRPVDAVEEEIRKHLREARQDEVLQELSQRLRARATVNIRLDRPR